jgi:hypothetical protein
VRRQRAETFADIVAREKAQPARGPSAPEGRHGDYWGDPDRRRFELVSGDLSPAEAVKLAEKGARVVYDACGCGGQECRLDWLSPEDVKLVSISGPPDLHPGKDGRANLEHWRSADGKDLVVAAVAVSWGGRIRG